MTTGLICEHFPKTLSLSSLLTSFRPNETQVCSCHNVTKGDIVDTVKSGKCSDLAGLKACTKAGTGCGGCVPLVQSILNRALKDAGQEVNNNRTCTSFQPLQASSNSLSI